MIEFVVCEIDEMNGKLNRFVKYLKSADVDDDAVFYSRLVACELITNVLRHCSGVAQFSAYLADSGVKITVCASSPSGEIAIPTLPDVLAESGRGLYIVNAVSGGNVTIDGGDVTVIIKRK
ncbi:MAG: ATP-binding protein [Candidatus Coproplasma sp.]